MNTLRAERYNMLLLAVEYLTRGDAMRERDIGRLETLIGDYRRSSLDHYAKAFGPTGTPVRYGSVTESLI